jgi:hypothetical protein
MKDLKSISISKDHAKLLLQTRGNIAVNYTSYLAKNFEDLEEEIILLENDFNIHVYISKIANDSDTDGIKTEDFVLIGGHLILCPKKIRHLTKCCRVASRKLW